MLSMLWLATAITTNHSDNEIQIYQKNLIIAGQYSI